MTGPAHFAAFQRTGGTCRQLDFGATGVPTDRRNVAQPHLERATSPIDPGAGLGNVFQCPLERFWRQSAVPQAGVPQPALREPGRDASRSGQTQHGRAAHESARRNWGKPADRPLFDSEQVRSLRVPPETLARQPCGCRTRHPRPFRGSLPGAVLAVRTCPFGQDVMYLSRSRPDNRLIHELG